MALSLLTSVAYAQVRSSHLYYLIRYCNHQRNMQLSTTSSTLYLGSLSMIIGSGGGSHWPGIGSLWMGSNREMWNTGYIFIVGGARVYKHTCLLP
jgi:hypothetical protein